jgi:hypothetical protein
VGASSIDRRRDLGQAAALAAERTEGEAAADGLVAAQVPATAGTTRGFHLLQALPLQVAIEGQGDECGSDDEINYHVQ